MMLRIRSNLFSACFGLLLALPLFAQAQPGEFDHNLSFKKTILDAEAVQQAARSLPQLAEEYKSLDVLLDQLTPLAGYQRSYLPIEIQPIEGELESKVGRICGDLTDLIVACRRKLTADKSSQDPKLYADIRRILLLHPGCYYLGLNDHGLCGHELETVISSIQIQDYPFVEAAESDSCLWDLAAHAPWMAELVAFGCDIDDATLTKMHLENCQRLEVLHLDENALTEVPLALFKTGKLRYVSFSKNQITHLPDDLKPLRGLVYLELYGNPISEEEQVRIDKGLPGTTVMFK